MMFGGLGFIFTLLYFAFLVWGVYLMYLATKALQIYIANNSNTKVIGGMEPVGRPIGIPATRPTTSVATPNEQPMQPSRNNYKNPEDSDQ